MLWLIAGSGVRDCPTEEEKMGEEEMENEREKGGYISVY